MYVGSADPAVRSSLVTHLQQLLFELLHLRQVELTEQVWHRVQGFSFPAWSVVSIYLSQPRGGVQVAVAAVAVLTVAISSLDGATVGTIRNIRLF